MEWTDLSFADRARVVSEDLRLFDSFLGFLDWYRFCEPRDVLLHCVAMSTDKRLGRVEKFRLATLGGLSALVFDDNETAKEVLALGWAHSCLGAGKSTYPMLLFALSSLALKTRQSKIAVDLAEKSAVEARMRGDKEIESLALSQIGCALLLRRELITAEAHFKMALDAGRGGRSKVAAHHGLALLRLQNGRLGEAQDQLKAASSSVDTRERRTVAVLEWSRGAVLVGLESWSPALSCLERAQALNMPSALDRARLAIDLSMLYQNQGQVHPAEEVLEVALEDLSQMESVESRELFQQLLQRKNAIRDQAARAALH